MAAYNLPQHLKGLSETEVLASRERYGMNQTASVGRNTILSLLLGIFKEPMLLLLFAISIIYVVVGEYAEAVFMAFAIIAVSAISLYQDSRSKKALEALEKLNEPLSVVIRNAEVQKIPTHEIVVGDLSIVEEGRIINADGYIVYCNDFSVNESSLTGESYSIAKSSDPESRQVYSGTIAVSGMAVFQVEQIGQNTQIGKIGESISTISTEASPLQIQIRRFVRGMAIAGTIVFLLVCLFSYVKTGKVIESLLSGLTMAMSVLPEEIPVAFTTFMALGAWKLMRQGIIVKRSSIVETLGSTTVICTDKTGTITENAMQLTRLYSLQQDREFSSSEYSSKEVSELIAYAMWSSEPAPFDPMEKAIHQVYEQTQSHDKRMEFKMVHEYPLEGKPPMMTHVFRNNTGSCIIAAKGAPEAILAVSSVSETEKETARKKIKEFGQMGYRVLGVARSTFEGDNFPERQQDLPFAFLGLVVFSDPPKKGIREVFQKIYNAGIDVKVITGDNADTTSSIAGQAGINNTAPVVNGNEVVNLPKDKLRLLAGRTVLFTRMFPEAKLSVINALKEDGEVVAMLGDGVNDGPALKAAHIGVAMGNKGTEIAKAAAAIVLTNDDLDKLVIGIAAGRRIYANIKKAIQYIISIHIPIILTVSLPLFLGWVYPQIFTPVHVIFLELVMGPTCSIIYENEPMEKNTMVQPPRSLTETFLNFRELLISIVQGLAITAGILFIYQWTVNLGGSEEKTRAMVFTTLLFANIFLSLSNRSFYYSILSSLKNKNILFPIIIVIVLILMGIILYFSPVSKFFSVEPLSIEEIGLTLLTAFTSVIWFEIYKIYRRIKDKAAIH